MFKKKYIYIKYIYKGKTSYIYATVPKKTINIKLPFLGPQTYIAKRKLSALITKFYPHVSIFITPSLTIQIFSLLKTNSHFLLFPRLFINILADSVLPPI